MAVVFTFGVLPRTPRYVLQLKCPIFTYFSMLVTMATKYQKDILGGRNSRMSLFILPY